MRRGKLFAFSRFFVRLKVGRWTADVPPAEGPTVYVCSHGNMAGPLVTLCWLPFPVRPWVFHVFAEKESCRKQFGEYTFSKRFGLPGPVARFLAWVVSGYVSTLVASAGAIPVYRGSVHIGTTFKESVAALQAGDSVLIFPDIDYTDSSDTAYAPPAIGMSSGRRSMMATAAISPPRNIEPVSPMMTCAGCRLKRR